MDWSKVDGAMVAAAFPFAQGEAASRPYREIYENGKYVFPGALLLIGQGEEVMYHRAFGCRSVEPELTLMKKGLVFDIASLTKPLLTTTLIMQAIEKGQLTIDRRLSHIFQSFGTHGKERITIKHLLTHCSGFPGILPFYRRIDKADSGERTGIMTSRAAVEMVYQDIFRAKPEHSPGQVACYSDVGFILLQAVLEVVSGGSPLDRLASRQIFSPLGLKSTGFIDLTKIKRGGLAPVTDQIVPTSNCPWRNRLLCGEVEDENAWAMGGVAGHAGVFSTAEDIFRLARVLLDCYHGRSNFVSKEIIRKFWTRDETVPGSSWALGWDTPSVISSSGRYFPPSAVGHLGYTGCSIWIDPERELVVILLSNRVHPQRGNDLIRDFRPRLHDCIREALGYAA